MKDEVCWATELVSAFNSNPVAAALAAIGAALLLIVCTAFYVMFSRLSASVDSISHKVGVSSPTRDQQDKAIDDAIASPISSARSRGRNTSTTAGSSSSAYRIDVEGTKRSSHEYTDRGYLWTQGARWNLPTAPRTQVLQYGMYEANVGVDYVTNILSRYNVDPDTGFLPKRDPLQRLPYARYHIWEDLADDLPKLLGVRMGQARAPLKKLPPLATDKLVTDAELRRAHMLLSFFAHAYVWGGSEPLDVIPEGIAVPLLEVSRRLEIPPVLSHTDLILYNYRRLDVEADVCMENLATLNMFFDGRDESWFYLITTEIEARGAATIVPMMLTIDAVSRFNSADNAEKNDFSRKHDQLDLFKGFDDSEAEAEAEANGLLTHVLVGVMTPRNVASYVTGQLTKMSKAIIGMCLSIEAMPEGCHPFIFYHRVRPFLSGWKKNPVLPNGVIYEGTGDERHEYYGGSAAQSALIPFLDICFGINHTKSRSNEFLLAMRDYMLKPHREFLQYCEGTACLREYVIDTLAALNIDAEGGEGSESAYESEKLGPFLRLRDSFNSCVLGIKRFRNGHMKLVADYIIAQHKGGAVAGDKKPIVGDKAEHDEGSGVAKNVKKSFENSAGGKGTGGTDLMTFLKPIRDDCTNAVVGKVSAATKIATARNTLSLDKPAGSVVEAAADIPSPRQEHNSPHKPGSPDEKPYYKSNSDPHDLDVYKKSNAAELNDLDHFRGSNNGGSIGNDKSHYKTPNSASWD